MPRSSPAPLPAPWLAALVKPGGASSSVKTDHAPASHHLMAKERDRHKKEERERERGERQEREKEREKERERERRRHASRSPIHMRSTSTNGQVKNETSSVPKSNPSLLNSLAPMPSFHHPGLQQPAGTMSSTAMLDRSRLGLPMHGLYGQSFDPFRDVLRGMDPLRESMDREQNYMRYAPANPLLPGSAGLGPSLYHTPPSHSTPERYRDFVGMPGLPADRFRDGLSIPAHLGHMAGTLGLSLPGPQNANLTDRYRDGLMAGSIPGMSGATMYPPTSTTFQFPGLGPAGILSAGLGQGLGAGGLSSLSMLPPSLLSSGGKRTPPPSTPMTGPMSNSLASLSRTHMAMMPPTLGLPPYPMPSPSPMLNPHLLPPMGSALNSTRPPSTPPIGRSLMDLTAPHHATGLAPYNPLDYPRKDDPQSR